MKKADIEWYVYEPLDWQKLADDQVKEDKCRYAIPTGFVNRQCRVKATVTLAGYGFCERHARLIRSRLGFATDERWRLTEGETAK